MSDKKVINSAQDALEIIELAVGDIETLARAFTVIDEVCQELQNAQPRIDEPVAKLSLN